MTDSTITRRSMLAATAALAMAGEAAAKPKPLLAGEVVERIKAHVGVPWRDKTVDGIIVGDPSVPVKGIATMMMATFEMVKQAVASGKNMIVSHEPVFWSHQEDVSQVEDNPLYREKLAYLKANDVVTFHFHDHWHALKPIDGITYGTARHLGWLPYEDAKDPELFALPEVSLGALAKELQAKMDARTLRVIGDPALKVKRARLSLGYNMKMQGIAHLAEDIEALIIGETWEWELMEYVKDLSTQGKPKSLIILGHIVSEQWGMDYCADWLKGFVKEVPVAFLPMKEPYWNPAAL
jgi:putative NIF3 family GTP cyclohydrolase 1 type 2